MTLFKKRREKTVKDLPTIEEFWEAFNKTKSEWQAAEEKRQVEAAEAEKKRLEWQKAYEKQREEWRERYKYLDKTIGRLGNTVGSFAEDFFASKAAKLLEPYGFTFIRVFQRVPVYDGNNKTLTDIDLMLSNGEYGMAIEVKSHLTREDVNFMLNKMPLIKANPPKEIDGKKLICGVAGISIDGDARERAFELGMFVFEQDIDMVSLSKPPEGFKAAEW